MRLAAGREITHQKCGVPRVKKPRGRRSGYCDNELLQTHTTSHSRSMLFQNIQCNPASQPAPRASLPAGMGSVLALVTGALGLLERRRLKAS
jgi:hypothetical protein